MYEYFDQIDVTEKNILIIKDPISNYSFAALRQVHCIMEQASCLLER